MIDYQLESKRLEEGGSYWKPKAGQYKVKFLSEIEPTDPYKRISSDGTEEINEQFKADIEINGENKTWTFGKGNTFASTYGQLVKWANEVGNSVLNKTVSVVVKSDGQKNDYTIVHESF